MGAALDHTLLPRSIALVQGGSGQTFDWNNLHPPAGLATRGWLLAGGLGPANVAQAVALTHPTGVDVSSGVCGPDGLVKDAHKVAAFIQGATGSMQPQQPAGEASGC